MTRETQEEKEMERFGLSAQHGLKEIDKEMRRGENAPPIQENCARYQPVLTYSSRLLLTFFWVSALKVRVERAASRYSCSSCSVMRLQRGASRDSEGQ